MVVRSVMCCEEVLDYKGGEGRAQLVLETDDETPALRNRVSSSKEIAMMIEIGSDPRVCPFCTLTLPNAPALVRHFDVAHGEFVQGMFEPQASGMLSERTLRFVEAEAQV